MTAPFAYPPPGPARPNRRRGLPVLIVGLVLVLIAGGVVGAVRWRHTHPSSSASSAATPGSSGALAPDATDTLAKQLSYELQTHNEQAFLSHMTGAALTAARQWWQNMNALGFDYGAVAVDGPPPSSGDDKTATFTASIGVHNPLDPTKPGQNDGDPGQDSVPATNYSLAVRALPDGTPLITSWKGTSNAPWDEGLLYVVHTKHAVVAGLPAERALVDADAKVAEKAAAWVLTFLKPYRNFVEQKGFVAFVSAKAANRAHWFSTSQKPKGWLADPNEVGGFFKPLPSVPANGDPRVSGLPCGGGYSVLGLKIAGAVNNEGIFVHEFTHALMSTNDLFSFGTAQPLPAWVVEGWARYIEAYFHDSPTNANPKSVSAKPFLSQALVSESHPAFTGAPPSDAQIYGQASRANYYYDVSASVYEYLSITYGDVAGFNSVLIAYIGGSDGPFAAILQRSSGGTDYYYPPGTIQAGWAKWYRSFYRG